MAIGIELSDGTDLDDAFELRQSGDPFPAETIGWEDPISESSIANNYAPASVGTAYGATPGLESVNGTDLGQIFAAKGSRPDPVAVSASNISASCGYDSSVGASSCTACSNTDVAVSGGDGNYSWEIVAVSGSTAGVGIESGGSGSGDGDGVQMCRTASEGSYSGTFEITVTDGEGNSDSDTFDFDTTHADIAP